MGTFAEQRMLSIWMPSQRWFIDKGEQVAAFTPEVIGRFPIGSRASEHLTPPLEIVLIARPGGGTAYQVPLSRHRTPRADLAHALIGVTEGPDGSSWVYDGLHDEVFVRAWLAMMADGVPDVDTPLSVDAAGGIRGVRPPGGWPIDVTATPKVLSGEQSNTSVIVGADRPNPLIAKAFRVVSPGLNPEVCIQSALARAECAAIAAPAGWVEAVWPDGTGRRMHLAYAAEFVAGSQDAWRVAVQAADSGQSFVEPARELGGTTARVHALMAEQLPTAQATALTMAELANGVIERAEWALHHSPALVQAPGLGPEHLMAAVRRAADVVRRAPLTRLQLVHGDYHLGQVLWSVTRGWILLDFEGEPLRPLEQRMLPDLVHRDIAGMLRSFDYAAGHVTDDDSSGREAQEWARQARLSFLDGYRAAGGSIAHDDPVLAALELDKALYEVVYETRNRPDWVGIPLRAVHRLISD